MLRLVAYAPDGVRRYPVNRDRLVVGSEPDCDIHLPYTGVAQRHAQIVWDGESLHIEDLGSRRGVLVGGKRVRQATLQVLDEIRLGGVTLLVEDVVPDETRKRASPPPPRRAPGPPRIDPHRMVEYLARLSDWVRADPESRTTVEAIISDLLEDFGGGILFLFHGELERAAIKFVGATEPDWMASGEELVEQIRARREGESPDNWTSFAFEGRLGSGKAWIYGHSFTAVERPYLLVAAFPQFRPDAWSPLPALRTLGDLLILGLVHHVGLYEPILPGQQAQPDLTLDPRLVVGESQAMRRVLEQLRAAVDPPVNVLFRGEPGVGKEILARSLHLSGPRRNGAFVVATCAGANPVQIEADLFGAEVPGKAGPVRRQGKLLLAHGGTLYLDEIEQLPLEIQARFVRFLRTGEIEPAGSRAVEKVDVRLVAASRGPLEPYVGRDLFRLDLAYRLSQFAIDVPPLRERREDLPLLIQSCINRFCHEAGRRVQGITVKAMSALMSYDYPGNLAELENIARQLVYLCPQGQPIDVNLLPERVRLSPIQGVARVDAGSDLNLERLVASCEQAAIREALRRSQGNKSEAARLLGLSRNGLALKMRRYGLRA